MGQAREMDHEAYQERTKSMSVESLEHIIKDASLAVEAAGATNSPNYGYYLDEIHYCSMELRRHRQSV